MNSLPPENRFGALTKPRIQEENTMAKEALEKADSMTLHRLFEAKCKDVNALADAMQIMAQNGKSGVSIERFASPDAVDAMKEVALAAIALADKIASKFES